MNLLKARKNVSDAQERKYMRRIDFSFAVILALLLGLSAVHSGRVFAAEMQRKTMPEYNLSVSFDLKKNLVRGTAVIDFPEPEEIVVSAGNLAISEVTFSGGPVAYEKKDDLIKASGKGTLQIKYEGVFSGKGIVENIENTGVVTGGLVSAEGISLTGNWYPSLKGLAHYRLAALVPAGFIAISEADEITYKAVPEGREYSFHFDHPVNGIDLAAGNYREVRAIVGDTAVYAYFFPEDVSLAETYIEYTRKYIAMYNKLLVPYPYKRFSVVENILPTGYSMPTFTLLGREVVRLPFIVRTSLGHEITHQWFGNYVYSDFSKGNWLEAITSYLSDHLYQEQEGKGWEYRKKILTDYQSYVSPAKDFPLRDFRERTDFASAAIGYGKGAMLFHMLRKIVGDETFFKTLRRFIEANKFRNATWEDVRRSFEAGYGKDLGWFFSQWLDRKGVPSIAVQDPRTLVLKGVPSVSFGIVQKKELYRLNVPLRIITEKGEEKKTVEPDREKQYFDITAQENPQKLIIDGDYDVMRRLQEDEIPPVISRLLGDEKRLIVYSENKRDIYAGLIDIFKAEGFTPKEAKDLKDEDIRSSSFLVLGYDSAALKRLFADVGSPGPGFVLAVRNNPLNTSKVVAYANSDSREQADAAARKIFHYGGYSTIRFEKGRNTGKETAETKRGMVFDLAEAAHGVAPRNSLPFDTIMSSIIEKPVIFVGERHPEYADHRVELDVVMSMYARGRKFAVGMEMFQRPFQKAIDDYLSGTVDERHFLKNSQYFKRWGYDYNLYREIIEFAKAKGVPIIALNAGKETVDKVAAGGLDALSAEEKKEIPPDMDMTDDAYRNRLKGIFEKHPSGPSFDNFYQAQILWDETMAHSVAEFLREKPDYQIVVLAGAGHVMYDSGIPQRLRRLTGREYATLVNDIFDSDIGNYVMFPGEVEAPFSAKLGVMLQEKDGGVIIKDFSKDSIAEKAGMKKEDEIIMVDDWKVDTPDDVRIALYDKKPFESVRVIALRKRFLMGPKELEFTVQL
jgi:aminopeptidase N